MEPEVRDQEPPVTAAPERAPGTSITVVPTGAPKRKRPRWTRLIVILVLVAGAGGAYWWTHRGPTIPPGIAFGNGRLEADEIDIQTKFQGRILKLLVDEGDFVEGGQVLAVMDTSDMQAQLDAANAQVRAAEKAVEEAKHNVVQLEAQERLAQQEYDRTKALLEQGWATYELFDQRTQALSGAQAALRAGQARLLEAQHALDAAVHNARLIQVNIADDTLVAPRWGRIQYRVANTGEVLPAGGRVFTMLDLTYVYMDIFLPTEQAGRVQTKSEARILLDAYPDRPIPAYVMFVATQNQFDPKYVEVRDERAKLLFRVRLRIKPELLRPHGNTLKSGLPGVGYVRTDPNTAWPEFLQANLVQ